MFMKKTFITAILCLILTSNSLSLGTWNSLINYPPTARANGVAFSLNNIIYMGTGALIDPLGNVNCFDDFWS